MQAILSIRPKYVEEILAGRKKYELRKKIFKQNVSTVYIYASSPTKKIVASFKIGKIIENEPIAIWKELNKFLGIEKTDYLKYFEKSSKAYAIEITNLKSFDPREPEEFVEEFKAPQSYSYLPSSILQSRL